MNRIDKKFGELKRARKKAFIAFITAGYPDLKTTEKLILEFDKIGVDIVELGVPFSDPMADGPVIQEASFEALKKGTHLIDILNLVEKTRKVSDLPIALMTYYNPIFCFGDEAFLKKAKQSGVDGVIIPDLPPEEAKGFLSLAAKYGIDMILFISPTTSMERVKYISSKAKGFIYYVSLTGVTGLRQSLSSGLEAKLKTIKKITQKPVCVGFGISDNRQARQAQGSSDGVIIGSAIVKKIRESIGKKNLVKNVSKFVNKLKG